MKPYNANFKKIPTTMVTGQKGVNLIESIVLSMGYAWHPTGSLEAGIDGFIELCDPVSRRALGSFVGVQSKVLSTLTQETDTNFTYTCDERDLDYWMQGNINVILIVSQPERNEAYWKSIKHYFQDPAIRREKKIWFDKKADKFEKSCGPQLLELGLKNDSGIYLAPSPKRETLYTNLLEIRQLPERIFVADSTISFHGQIRTRLRELGGSSGSEWLLKSKQIISFWDLSEYPWTQLCDVGTMVDLELKEWLELDPTNHHRYFVELLDRAIVSMMHGRLKFDREKHCLYFPSQSKLDSYKQVYKRGSRMSSLTVFQRFTKKKDPSKTAFIRHMAFRWRFKQLEGKWYLEIYPSYHFTIDGFHTDRFYEEHLSQIKMIERSPRIFSQVILWQYYLTRPPDLFNSPYPFLAFGDLMSLEVEAGIDDRAWLEREEPRERSTAKQEMQELRLFE